MARTSLTASCADGFATNARCGLAPECFSSRRQNETFLNRHVLERRFEQRSRRAGDLPEVVVQGRVGSTQASALCAVGLEVGELNQDFRDMPRALARDRRREPSEVGQGRVVVSPGSRRRGWHQGTVAVLDVGGVPLAAW